MSKDSRKERAEPQDALDKAADIIDELGWTQRSYHGPDGGVCCLGAIQLAVGAGPTSDPIHDAARLLCRRVGAPDPTDRPRRKVVEWNDAPGRTREQVTAALRGDTR